MNAKEFKLWTSNIRKIYLFQRELVQHINKTSSIGKMFVNQFDYMFENEVIEIGKDLKLPCVTGGCHTWTLPIFVISGERFITIKEQLVYLINSKYSKYNIALVGIYFRFSFDCGPGSGMRGWQGHLLYKHT